MCRFKLLLEMLHKVPVDFNTSYVSVQVTTIADGVNFLTFQYILCVGSRFVNRKSRTFTLKFQYILCVGSREDYIKQNKEAALFQYILCVGSRNFLPLLIFFEQNFNTSYVSVQEYAPKFRERFA